MGHQTCQTIEKAMSKIVNLYMACKLPQVLEYFIQTAYFSFKQPKPMGLYKWMITKTLLKWKNKCHLFWNTINCGTSGTFVEPIPNFPNLPNA